MKLNLQLLICLITIGILSACDNTPTTIDPTSDTEAVYFNGKIYTVNPDQPWADAMYINDGIIQFVH